MRSSAWSSCWPAWSSPSWGAPDPWARRSRTRRQIGFCGIPAVLERFPEATVRATAKGKGMLVDLLGIDPDRIRAVNDGETLDLGGLTLEFLHAPWVHWSETMLTWLPERRTLFTCDLFGAHVATADRFACDEAATLEAAKRHFGEIMMPFRTIIPRRPGPLAWQT